MLNAGDRIGDWIIESTLGEGGMGAVFTAHNVLSTKVRAAIKVLKPHNMGDARARFVREVELLASVQHPAVVRVLGCGEDEKRNLLFMAMELLDGEELTDRLKRGPLSIDEAAKYFTQLGQGLISAHRKGVVHRDIKPQNILICTDGTAKLLDFGIAMQQGGTKLTQGGLVPGTIAYMPPEVFEGLRPDHRADIYALGLVFWEALTGEEAYPEDGGLTPDQNTVKTMGSKLNAQPMELGESFPEGIRNLVRAATDPEPNARLTDLTPFVKLLEEGGHGHLTMADLLPARGEAGDTYGFDLDAMYEDSESSAGSASVAPPAPAAEPAKAASPPPPPVSAPASGGSSMGLIAGLLVVLILIGGALLVVVGGGGALLFGGGAAAYMATSDSTQAPVPPQVPISGSNGTNGSTGPKPVAGPAISTGPAPKGWMKGKENGLPRDFPFSVPKDAEFKTSMGNTSNGLYSAVVIFDTSMGTDELFSRYKSEAEAANLQVYPTRDKNGATVAGIGTKAVMSAGIEEFRNSTTVTISWMPDRGD